MRLPLSSAGPRIAICVLAPLMLAAASGPAFACSCQPDPTAEGLLASETAVFTGVVEESAPASPGQSTTVFKVTESFKGPRTGAIVRVRHPNGPSASCGVTFSPGEVRTIAASRQDPADMLSTSQCSTWMFLPQVGLSKGLIEQMRRIRQRP
jgi:hypothetical protein